MDANRFATEQLKKGKSSAEVRMMLVERGYSLEEARVIACEAAEIVARKPLPIPKQPLMRSMLALAFLAMAVLAFWFLWGSAIQTRMGTYYGRPSSIEVFDTITNTTRTISFDEIASDMNVSVDKNSPALWTTYESMESLKFANEVFVPGYARIDIKSLGQGIGASPDMNINSCYGTNWTRGNENCYVCASFKESTREADFFRASVIKPFFNLLDSNSSLQMAINTFIIPPGSEFFCDMNCKTNWVANNSLNEVVIAYQNDGGVESTLLFYCRLPENASFEGARACTGGF